MSDIIQLKDTCDWLLGEGILSSLTTNYDVPWKEVITDGEDLDLDYYGNRSGEKPISHLTEKLLDNNHKLSQEDTLRLAAVVYNKYKDNWDRAWLALQEEYDPLHNYEGDETETTTWGQRLITMVKGQQINSENLGQFTETKGQQINTNGYGSQENVKGQQVNTNDIAEVETTHGAQKTTVNNAQRTDIKGSETVTVDDNAHTDTNNIGKRKRTTDTDIYGFNSSGASNDNKSTINDDAATDSTQYGATHRSTVDGQRSDTIGQHTDVTDQDQYKDTVGQHTDTLTDGQRTDTIGSRTDTLTEGQRIDTTSQKQNSFTDGQRTDTDTRDSYIDEIHRVRGGNYGMTTTQKMLTEELELRAMYNFFDFIVYPQLDKVLCMSYYKDTNRGLF